MASDPVKKVHCVIRRGQATREWRCTGSNCLPARGGSFLDLALRHFSTGGALHPAGTSASFVLSRASTSALFSVVSALVIVYCGTHHGCSRVGLLGALHHHPIFSCSPGHLGQKTSNKDFVTLAQRRHLLGVRIRGCTSLLVVVGCPQQN